MNGETLGSSSLGFEAMLLDKNLIWAGIEIRGSERKAMKRKMDFMVVDCSPNLSTFKDKCRSQKTT